MLSFGFTGAVRISRIPFIAGTRRSATIADWWHAAVISARRLSLAHGLKLFAIDNCFSFAVLFIVVSMRTIVVYLTVNH